MLTPSIWQILGCAIVVTVILGCFKLGYTHWKSSTLPEKERIEQEMQRQMSHRRRAGSDVPFGIRAIESGIEVEGVWISRPTTPDGTGDSAVASSKYDQGPRKDFIIDIESQVSFMSSTLDRPSSAGRPSDGTSRDSSLDSNMSKPGRSNHPPLAYSKYTGNPALQGSVTDTLERLDAVYRTSGPKTDSSMVEERLGSSGSSDKSGTDSALVSASAPRLLNRERSRQQSADLDLRRMSQAAETGQLTPRVRRENSHDYFCPSRKQSPPPPTGRQDSPNSKSPLGVWPSRIDNLPPALRRSSLPDVLPFTQFCLTAPASPLSRPASPASSINSIGSSSSSSRPSTGERGRSLPLAPPVARTTVVQQASPPRSSFEKRDSTILRGHGTGFEILQPGTHFKLQSGTHSTHTPDPTQRNAPPISLLNSADQNRRKLQKKRRPSIELDRSSWEGRSSIT